MIKKWKSLDGFEKVVVILVAVLVTSWGFVIAGVIHQSSLSTEATKFCILSGYDRTELPLWGNDISCEKTFTWEEWHDAK
jgi:hypothetical protein